MRDLIKELEKYSMHISMPDGTIWEVPAKHILEHKAKYYAKVDGISFEKSLKNECNIVFYIGGSNMFGDIITDWASNNMDWKDVIGVAKKATKIEYDYHEEWSNSPKYVIKNE